jgi:hypothetical protein
MPAPVAVALVVLGVVVAIVGIMCVIACLLFGMWILRQTGDVSSLREAGQYIAKIPFPRLTIQWRRGEK